jgi:plastocyanin
MTKNIEIAKFAFVPKEITIEPGTRLRWTNRDETPHTVTSQTAKKVLSSPGLDLDDHYEFVFNDEGDYPYLCTVHPMMTGIVHVRKSGSKAP